MSKKNCSNCQFSIQDFPDLFCLFRKLHTQDGLFENCHCFLPKSVFHRITASPEVLANFLVFHNCIYKGHIKHHSAVVGGEFDSREEAYAATVAKLNEVCVEQNAVDYTQPGVCKTDDTQKEVEDEV
jgi:hypothetical protein